MGSGLLFGGTLVASVLAGSIALFAPCCISVMLPAYLAGAFQNRGRRVAMTFLYGVGVATVILPIALGAIVLRQVIFGDHSIVFTTMGVLLLGLGVWVLAGGQLHLPAPGGGKPSRSGPLGVYLLGVASGITTSCCAPVLAGVIALSGTAGSLPAALSVGAAYVFGMVAPLFAVAIIWQQVDPGRFRWFGPPPRGAWAAGGAPWPAPPCPAACCCSLWAEPSCGRASAGEPVRLQEVGKRRSRSGCRPKPAP